MARFTEFKIPTLKENVKYIYPMRVLSLWRDVVLKAAIRLVSVWKASRFLESGLLD